MDRIAIIGSGIMAKVFAERAAELGIESHCFSWDKSDVACGVADYFHEVNIFDTTRIEKICRERKITGIVATTELTILPVAKVANNLGLVGNGIDVSEKITNKYLTRKRVSGVQGLNQPRFWVYAEGRLPEVDCYPVIVKPIAAGGKRGINVVGSRSELKHAIDIALPFSKVKGVLIEQYLNGGMEFSVESLSYHGKHYIMQVTLKDTSGPPHCNELGHHQPACISERTRESIEKTLAEMLTAARIDNGPCHTEIKIVNDKIYLIEINARPGGDHITYPLTELSTGYPFVSGILWIALDQFELHIPENLKNGYSGIYFITEETAQLKPVFDHCEEYSWLYKKHQVNNGLSKIIYNDEESQNYFIYFDKNEKPDMLALLKKYNQEK